MPGNGMLLGSRTTAWALALPGLSLTAQPSLFLPKGEAPPQRHPDRNAGKKQRHVQGGQPEEKPLSAAQPLPQLCSWGQCTPTHTPSWRWAIRLIHRCWDAAYSPGQGGRAGAGAPAPPAFHPRASGSWAWGERLWVLPLQFATVS